MWAVSLAVVGTALAAPVGVLLGLVLDRVGETIGLDPTVVVGLVVLAVVVASAAAVARATTVAGRAAVLHAHDRPVMRALEVPLSSSVVARAGIPALAQQTFTALAALGALRVLADTETATAVAAVAVVAGATFGVSGTVWASTVQPRSSRRLLWSTALAVVALAAGIVVAPTVGALLSGADRAGMGRVVPALGRAGDWVVDASGLLAVCLVLLAAVSTVAAGRRVRALDVVVPTVDAGTRSRPSALRTAALRRAPGVATVAATLGGGQSGAARALAAAVRATAVLAAGLVGLGCGAPGLLDGDGATTSAAARLLGTGTAFALGGVLAALATSVAGPLVLGGQLRFSRDSGLGVRELARGVVVAHLLVCAPALLLLGVGAALLLGRLEPLLLAVAAWAGSCVAHVGADLVPGMRQANADGTAEPGLAGVGAGAAVTASLAIVAVVPVVGAALSAALAVLGLPVLVVLMERRVLR